MVSNKPVYVVILAALLSLLPLRFFSIGPVDVDLFKIMLALSMVVYCGAVAVEREAARVPGDRQIMILLGLLSVAVLSGLWAKDAFLTLSRAFGLARFVLFYLLVVLLTRREKDLEIWLYCLPWAAVIALGYNILMFSHIPGLRHLPSKALIGSMGAAATVAVLPATFLYLFSRRWVTSLCSFALLMGCGTALVFSANRIAVAVVLINLVVFSVGLWKVNEVSWHLKRRLVKFATLAVLAGVMAFGVVAFATPRTAEWYRARMVGTFSSEYRYYDTSYYWRDNLRLQIWDAALQMATAAPLRGVGFGNFKTEFLGYYPYFDDGRVAHNIYLGMLAETGPIGLGLLLALLASAFYNYRAAGKSLRRANRERSYLLVWTFEVTFLGILVHSAFRPTLYEFPLYVFLALSVSCHRLFTVEPQIK